MKKVIVIVAAFVMVFAGKVSAQSAPSVSEIVITKIALNEGYNRVILKTGSGTLTFYKERDRFSGVVFYDEAGNATELRAADRDSFGSADGSICLQFYVIGDAPDDSSSARVVVRWERIIIP